MNSNPSPPAPGAQRVAYVDDSGRLQVDAMIYSSLTPADQRQVHNELIAHEIARRKNMNSNPTSPPMPTSQPKRLPDDVLSELFSKRGENLAACAALLVESAQIDRDISNEFARQSASMKGGNANAVQDKCA